MSSSSPSAAPVTLEDVREAAGVGRATVSIAAFATVTAGLLPRATSDLRARRPDLRIDVRIMEPEDGLDELVAGRVDLATTIDSAAKSW